MSSGTHDDRLTETLVGDDYRNLYLSNAWFKRGIDRLVVFLPGVVADLAAQASQRADDQAGLLDSNYQAVIP